MNTGILNYRESPTLSRKRDRILNNSLKLFISNGIDETTMIDLAASAAITRRTIYNYYDSKEKIAADLKMIILAEIDCFNLLKQLIEQDSATAYKKAAKLLNDEYREYFLFLSIFDTYFSTIKIKGKYKRFLNDEYRQLAQLLITQGMDEETLGIRLTRLQLFLNFSMRQMQKGSSSFMGQAEYFIDVHFGEAVFS